MRLVAQVTRRGYEPTEDANSQRQTVEKEAAMRVNKLQRTRATLAMGLLALGFMLSGGGGGTGLANTVSRAIDCEGNACGQVTLAWDESKQQYKAQNNSTDRWVRVEADNLAGSASVCVKPGQADYLDLKSIVGTYRANYGENTCGMVKPPA